MLDERAAARAPQQEFGAVPLELTVSPRRAHRQLQALNTATTNPQPALAGQRQSVWDQ
ncbi:hypothetical protein [Microbacterium sp. oral taxon 186]|nr:hypothetical protein [Microbacterium sp. oral taxon 186]